MRCPRLILEGGRLGIRGKRKTGCIATPMNQRTTNDPASGVGSIPPRKGMTDVWGISPEHMGHVAAMAYASLMLSWGLGKH